MPSPAFDTPAEIRKLQEAGCAEEQAEAMVDLVSRTPTDPQVFKRFDRVDTRLDRFESSVDVRFERLEGHVDVCFERLDGRMENLEDRVKGMVTETMFVKEFAKLYKHLLIGGVGICAVIVTAFAAVLTTFIALSLS